MEKVTVRTKTVGSKKGKSRTYDAQIVRLEDKVVFYLMKTHRDIRNFDHIMSDEIVAVTFEDASYIVENVTTFEIGKSKYPVLETSLM